MAIVNYVREHMRFIEYAADEKINASERLLWYALMHIANQRAQGNIWPDEFIRVNNDRLLTLCPIKMDTLAKARNGLKQRGLIDFLPGEKNRKSPAYKINYFYPQQAEPATFRDGEQMKMDIPAGYAKKSDYTGVYTGDYMGDNTGVYTGDNMGDYTGDYNININIQDIQKQDTESDEEEDSRGRARARARALLCGCFRAAFGKEMNPETAEKMAHKLSRFWPFEDMAGVVEEAVSVAAQKQAGSPADYLNRLFADWWESGVRTREDAQERMIIRDGLRGKSEIYTPEQAMRMMDEMMERARV